MKSLNSKLVWFFGIVVFVLLAANATTFLHALGLSYGASLAIVLIVFAGWPLLIFAISFYWLMRPDQQTEEIRSTPYPCPHCGAFLKHRSPNNAWNAEPTGTINTRPKKPVKSSLGSHFRFRECAPFANLPVAEIAFAKVKKISIFRKFEPAANCED